MILSADQTVSLHTYRGVQAHQFAPSQLMRLKWNREMRQTSKCSVTVPNDGGRLPDIVPWLHWMSVWDGRDAGLLWRGPVQHAAADSSVIQVSARDQAAYLMRTRCPITKRWDAADPGDIAGELWSAMLAEQGVLGDPVVRPNPLGDRYDYHAEADVAMMDSTISDLVGFGLYWSVVAGTPILGPAPLQAVTSLGEHDFIDPGIQITRDGSRTFNDVLVRGADNIARARVEVAGLNLQTNVHIDNMFGVSNANKAARRYVAYTSKIRDELSLPEGARLHPDAPVTVDQLVPSTRFVVEGHGLLSLMELANVEVTVSDGGCDVAVKMSSVDDDLPELVKIVQQTVPGEVSA